MYGSTVYHSLTLNLSVYMLYKTLKHTLFRTNIFSVKGRVLYRSLDLCLGELNERFQIDSKFPVNNEVKARSR